MKFSNFFNKDNLTKSFKEISGCLPEAFGLSLCHTDFQVGATTNRGYLPQPRQIQMYLPADTEFSELAFAVAHEYIHSVQDFCMNYHITAQTIDNFTDTELQNMASEFFSTNMTIAGETFRTFVQNSPFFSADIFPILSYDDVFYVSPQKTDNDLKDIAANANYFTNLTEVMANYYAGLFCKDYCESHNIDMKTVSPIIQNVNEYLQVEAKKTLTRKD